MLENKIEEIFIKILGNQYKEVTEIDSISYVELMIALQNEFKIKFSTQEFLTLRSAEKIKENIKSKLKS